MIFSESRQFVFFAVPKTGTHAVRAALRPHLSTSDWEQQLRYGQQLSPLPKVAEINHGHVSYRQLSDAVGEGTLQTLFSFAFTRHPFDRFVSVCAFLARTDPSYDQDPIAWMKRALLRPQFCERVLVAPQHALLSDDTGAVVLDFVGRYESLQADFNAVCDRLALPNVTLPHRNRSEHDAYQNLLDNELADALWQRYEQDFVAFNYSP
jgi:hypothetical protein